MEFRLIVKNSFIEIEEPPPSEMRRAHSWETMRSFGNGRSLNSEPFTILARRSTWEPPVTAISPELPLARQTSASAFLSTGESEAIAMPVPPTQAASSSSSFPPTVAIDASVVCDLVADSSSCSPDPAHVPLPGPLAPSASSTAPSPVEAAAVGAEVAAAIGSAVTEDEGRTTVMLRNVPVSYTRDELLATLEAGGFQGRFDFVYLPVDFTRNIGLGYALICLASPFDAELLLRHFDGFDRWGRPEHGTTPCEASWSEPRQGMEEHIERYRNSPVMHKSVPEEYKPVIFVNGNRVPFPAPTKAIRAPRIRHLKASS
jgi:hypothetical protein